MTLRSPAWLQNGESYSASTDRLSVFSALTEAQGVVDPEHMKVIPSNPASMNLTITGGHAIVKSSVAGQGSYSVSNDGGATVTIPAANSTNPRIDRIVLTVRDSDISGSNNDAVFQVLSGTPSSTPAIPAAPSNSITLATVTVGRGAGSINANNIDNTTHRDRVSLRRSLGSSILMVSGAAELNALANQYRSSISKTSPLIVFRTDAPKGREVQYSIDGKTWVPVNEAPNPQEITMHGVGPSLVGGSAANADGFLMQAGTTAHKTDQHGNAEVKFPKAFPNGLLSVVVTNGHHAVTGTLHYDLVPRRPSQNNASYANYKDRFLYRVHDADGTVKKRFQHRINWIAIGW